MNAAEPAIFLCAFLQEISRAQLQPQRQQASNDGPPHNVTITDKLYIRTRAI